MQVTAALDLAAQPRDMAILPTGELIVWSWSVKGIQIDAYDGDLAGLWSRNLGPNALGMQVDSQGVLWVVDRSGGSAYTRRGDVAIRVEAPTVLGMEVAALTFVHDDVIFAYQHGQHAPPDRPALVRMTRSGRIRWSVRLNAEQVAFHGTASRTQRDPAGRLLPTDWVCGYLNAGDLRVSGDLMLAIYSDMPRSGIAIGYVTSLADGALRYVTKQGPIHCVQPLGAGVFLVGYMGYGAFETILYNGRGTDQQRWNSHGHYVVNGRDIVVIEMNNADVFHTRLARLMADGSVVRGDLLEGYYTSHPYLHTDGTVYFARQGLLIAAKGLMIENRIVICHKSRHDAFHTRVVAGSEGLFATYSINRLPRSESSSGSTGHESGLVRVRT